MSEDRRTRSAVLDRLIVLPAASLAGDKAVSPAKLGMAACRGPPEHDHRVQGRVVDRVARRSLPLGGGTRAKAQRRSGWRPFIPGGTLSPTCVARQLVNVEVVSGPLRKRRQSSAAGASAGPAVRQRTRASDEQASVVGAPEHEAPALGIRQRCLPCMQRSTKFLAAARFPTRSLFE